MADKRSKSHRAPDRTGLTWVTWAEKYAPQTTGSSSSVYPPKVEDNVMRIRSQDIGLYGLCPRHDECCLVVCNQCKQVIRLQALYSHYERRHSNHLMSSRNHHSSHHKETYKNSNTNGPIALTEKPRLPSRRDSSSGSSDCLRGNSAKETVVTSSSKRKLSVSSQWDSDDSSSESDSGSKGQARSNRNNLARQRSTDVSHSETSARSSSKKSVQVNGVKVTGMTGTTHSSSVGVGKSQHSTSAVSANKSSSKHITSSSQAASESRLSIERLSKSYVPKMEAPKLESTLLSKTSEKCDSSSKSYSDFSKNSACKTRDSKDRLGSAASSLKSSHSSCDSSGVTKELSKNSKSSEPLTSNLERIRSRSKHSSVSETKSISNHPSFPPSLTSTYLPSASRSSSNEEGRSSAVSKSTTLVLSSKLVSDSSLSRTVATDISASSRSTNLSCRNGPDISQHETSKADRSTSAEPSRSSSKTSSKSLRFSTGVTTSKVDTLHDTSQRHSSKLSHHSLSNSNLQPKSASSQPPEVKSKSKSEPKSELKSESKSDRVGSGKSHSLEGRNMSASSELNRTVEKTTPHSVVVADEPSDTDFAGSLENSILQRLSKKSSKNRSKPKSSSQFCKDREFDADKHCGVLVADTGKPCTHSLTCKIHALSLRRTVAGRTKPFDQLLSEHRAFKEALLHKKLELQKVKANVDVTSPLVVTTPAVVSTPCLSPTHSQTQRSPPANAGSTQVTENALASNPPPTTPVLVRSPRPRPKPRFRSSIFRSSQWFSVLAPATGVSEKQIARPLKLPVFPKESAITLQDGDSAFSPNGTEDGETSSSFRSSSYLLRHPKPIAVNRFGAWRIGQGCAVFSHREDLCRSIVEDMVDNHLRPPPHKKLCVEASLPVNISESLGPSICDPYHFTAADGSSSNVAASSLTSSCTSSAFLSPSVKCVSKSKARSSPFSAASHDLATFAGSSPPDGSVTGSISSRLLDPHDSDTRSVSQLNSTANHQRLLSSGNALSVEKYVTDFSTNTKVPISERGGNSNHGLNSESILRLPNGQHPQVISQSEKRQSHADGVQYIDDTGYGKQQKKADGVKVKADNWGKVRTDSLFKASDAKFKDRQGVHRTSSYEFARPSVIAFGSQASQRSMENSCHPTSSLSVLNGLQPSYRGLQSLNHKPPHISNLVSRDRHLGSQSSTPSSAPSLKTTTQVNRTLGVPMT